MALPPLCSLVSVLVVLAARLASEVEEGSGRGNGEIMVNQVQLLILTRREDQSNNSGAQL